MADALSLNVGYATDPGLVRRENQDALDYRIPEDPAVRDERGALFVVCDGIGGLSAGGQASRMALQAFIQTYYALPYAACDRLLRQAAEQANAAIFEANRGRSGPARMGTTLVAAAIIGRELWAANLGDSRCYIWRAGALDQLTHDHAPAARRANDRQISRALGAERAVNADLFGPVQLAAGDCLLLCTDGLSTAVSNQAIARTLREFTGQSAARQLLLQTQTAGARDNVSILVVNIADTAPATSWFSGQRAVLRSMLARVTWADLDPWRIISTGHWRTRRGLVVLLLWMLLALLLGLSVGWLVTFSH
jgi:protein phosphatase